MSSIYGGSLYPVTIEKSIDDASWVSMPESFVSSGVGIRTASAVARSLGPAEAYALVIGVRRAVTAICNNVMQARPRLYTRSGQEVLAGPVYDMINRPYPRMTWTRWVREWVEDWLIWGEHAAWVRGDDKGRRLEILKPPRLSIAKPRRRVDRRADVQAWAYQYPSGKTERIPDSELVFDRMSSPGDPIRGLSPLVTGATQAGVGHFASLYNQAFFVNDAVPRGMLKVPNMGQSRLEDFERQFRDRFGSDGGGRVNYHKIMFAVTSGEVEWIPFSQPADGSFLEVQKWAFELIGSLYGVPPVEMHNLQKTRFDTADIERKLFAESTIIPLLDQIAGELQMQVIEPYYGDTEVVTAAGRMSRGMSMAFDRAVSRSGGSVVLLLDADTMPVMASVKASLVETAAKFRTALGASPQETIDFFGVDLPTRPERQDVYMPKTEWNVTHPERNPEVQIAAEANQRHADDAARAAANAKGENGKGMRKLVRTLRVWTLERLFPRDGSSGELWSLEEADGINRIGDQGRKLIRRIRHDVRAMQGSAPGRDVLRQAIKDYFGKLAKR